MRYIKTLGLALVAVFAMSVVVASAAQAANFTATKAPAIITGHQEGTENFFEVPGTGSGVKTECTAPTFEGTQSTTSASSLTIIPKFEAGGKCFTSLGTNATIDMNGCDFSTTIVGFIVRDTWAAIFHIVCSAGQEIQITSGPCTIDVKAQTISGVTYTNTTNAESSKEDVTSDINATFKATVTNIFLCPFTGEQNGRYVSKITAQGYEDLAGSKEGNQVGVLVD